MNKPKQEMKVQKGQTFPLTIKRLGINGEGVGYFKRQVVFVPGALPDEEVVVEATNVQRNFAEGRIKRIRKNHHSALTRPVPSMSSVEAASFSTCRMKASLIQSVTLSHKPLNVIAH